MNCEPITLSNEIVTLEPIALSHTNDLTDALDPTVFAYMPMRSSVVTPNEVRRYIEFQMMRTNTISFAVIDNATGRAIGSTSYMNISPDHYGLEIGSTWITRAARGTKVNPAMKLLLLEHAFETLGAIRVVLCTDQRNEQSKRAISKLGAQFEGHPPQPPHHARRPPTRHRALLDHPIAMGIDPRSSPNKTQRIKKPSSRGKGRGLKRSNRSLSLYSEGI